MNVNKVPKLKSIDFKVKKEETIETSEVDCYSAVYSFTPRTLKDDHSDDKHTLIHSDDKHTLIALFDGDIFNERLGLYKQPLKQSVVRLINDVAEAVNRSVCDRLCVSPGKDFPKVEIEDIDALLKTLDALGSNNIHGRESVFVTMDIRTTVDFISNQPYCIGKQVLVVSFSAASVVRSENVIGRSKEWNVRVEIDRLTTVTYSQL
ncbi:MAG: hypothetical protein E6Q68_06200 [Polynucleobacter sp.]|nr:MAG: hypothetical protein E6Q68_06200 [Polynucleobacter sp.]